jgi:hypothetical protein
MDPVILIIGPTPEPDVALLRECARKSGVTTDALPDTGRLAASMAGKKTLGFVSYIPLVNNQTHVFPVLIEHGANVPVFQRIADSTVSHLGLAGSPFTGVFVSPLTPAAAWSMVLSMVKFRHAAARNDVLVEEVAKYQKQKSLLVEVGTALSHENDLNRLLDVILTVSRDIVEPMPGAFTYGMRSGPGGAFRNLLFQGVAERLGQYR